MSVKERPLRSQALDLLRFPLAIVVMCIHVTATRSYQSGIHTVRIDKLPGADIFFGLIDAFLRDQSVPIYFFIAGYVFFLGIELTIDTYGHKISNRSKSLLIPYIFWNLLAAAYLIISMSPSVTLIAPPAGNFIQNFTVSGFLETFWNSWYGLYERTDPFPPGGATYPQDYPLWFVRDLMIIVVSAPLIYWSLKHTRAWLVTAAGLAWFILSPVRLGHPGQLLTGFFFFGWGAWMSYHKHDMIADFSRHFKLSLAAYILLACAHFAIAPTNEMAAHYIKNANVFCGMIMAYGLAARIARRINSRGGTYGRFLPAASFTVYAGHGLIVAPLNACLLQAFTPATMAGVVSIYILNLISTTLLLLLIFFLTGRYAPWLQQIIAGRKTRF